MSDSIRKFKNNDELIKELEQDKKLIFPDENSRKIFKSYLMQYGYYAFVKKMSNNLMYFDVNNKIFKPEFTSNNLRYLFDVDRNISSIIFKYFRNIEFLLNSSLLKIVAKKLNKNAKCPYIAALDNQGIDDLFPNINSEMPIFKKYGQNTYLNFYDDIFKNFNNNNFDCREAIELNKSNENDEIKKMIKDGWFRSLINNNQKNKKKLKPDWEYLDIFSLFQILSLSQLIRIFSYLSISSKNEVIKEFCNDFQVTNKHLKLKSDSFNDLINIFSNLRNLLMHNGSLMKFRFKLTNDEIRLELKKYFNIDIPSLEIRLKEVIIIMESIININGKIFNEILDSIAFKFKNRTHRSDNVSKLIFEIIENETRIKVNYNI